MSLEDGLQGRSGCQGLKYEPGVCTFSFSRASLIGRLVRGIVTTGPEGSEDMMCVSCVSLFNCSVWRPYGWLAVGKGGLGVVLTSACVPRWPEVCVSAASLAGARAQKVRDGENLPAHPLTLHELVRPVIWAEKGQDGAHCCCKHQLQKPYRPMKLNI